MSARSRGAVALALTTLWSMPAQAESAPADARVLLEWSRGPGAESCLSPEEAATEVERLLARPVFASSSADRRLVVSIERTTEPPGYTAHMTLFAASGAALGDRVIAIEAERCEQATEAFTLALSIMADLPRTPEELASAPTPPARDVRRDEVPSAPATSQAPRPRPAARIGVGVGPAAAIVTSSAVSPGGHLSLLVEPKSFLPVLGAVVSTVRPHETFASRRAWLSSTRVEAALCLPPLTAKALALFACVGPEATFHFGWGAGFGDDRSGMAATLGGVARAYVRHPLASNVHVFASIAVAATPRTLEVAFTDPGGARRIALETSYFSPSLSIGVAFDDYLGKP